jgi:hypothetical protein
MAKKSGAIEKRGSAALANWDEELAKAAADVASKEQMPTGSFVSLKSGVMSIGGSPIKDNKLEVVIIDHVYENTFYEGDFDPDNPQPPACYAFGRTEEELKPHEKSSGPVHDQCQGCDNNVFGSAEKGKGKACKNTRRLALISADGLSPDSIKDGQVVYLKLPVTSTKAWSMYVKSLAAVFKRPPYGVVTEISVLPDAKSQFKVVFNRVDNIPAQLAAALMARKEKIAEEIMFPYGDPSPKEAKGRGKKIEKPKARKF